MTNKPDFAAIARMLSQHSPISPIKVALRWGFVGVLVGACLGGVNSYRNYFWNLEHTTMLAVHTAAAFALVGFIWGTVKARRYQQIMNEIGDDKR